MNLFVCQGTARKCPRAGELQVDDNRLREQGGSVGVPVELEEVVEMYPSRVSNSGGSSMS